ncbi:hypothetical protein [Kitasatospora sp. NBC_01302]|uniref:hypothetical protein n=1 Tax=Kitasatospora sp. NBC_01302 TaxID=2903575 RepID=UPI002E13C24D|nr:hypothetical protein OG294_18300 [Kitasatospora sp. NBC_01302]
MSIAVDSDGASSESSFERDFCGEMLPRLLVKAGASREKADLVARDVAGRAQATVALPAEYFDVLITPFLEEVTQHRPINAPAWLRAAVVVVVRNSSLEELHALNGLLSNRDIAAITEAATVPLRALLEAPAQPIGLNPLAGLDVRYPRAWACMAALSDLMAASHEGEINYESPHGPMPMLPRSDELVQVKESSAIKGVNRANAVVASAVDPRFDQALIGLMKQIQAGAAEVVPLSALSRLSRSSEKQFRVLEFLLAHNATVLTTNYLLSPGAVAVRERPFVKPDSYNPVVGWRKERGLSPAHRDLAREIRKLF